MATFRSRGTIDLLQDKMVGRMIDRGYDPDFARRCFDQIKGFGEYGFPESHAASFAHLVYVSSWLKWKYPAAFAAALLNSQPMGFYAPAQIVRDAQEHGVEVRAVDVNESEWGCTLEAVEQLPPSVRVERSRDTPAPQKRPSTSLGTNGKGLALRLGLRQIDGLRLDAATRIIAARGDTPYASVEAMKIRAGVNVAAVERLAGADAFRSMGLDRRAALWDAKALKAGPDLPLFAAADARDEGWETEVVRLPDMPLGEHVVADYQAVRLSLKAHPMRFLRTHYAQRGFVTADKLRSIKYGRRVSLAGLVLIRQRPGSAKGVCFITLEDETGVANLVIWPDAFAAQRKIVMGARLMVIHGMVQHDEEVVHVVAQRLEDDTAMLRTISEEAMPSTLSAGDGGGSWKPPAAMHPRNVQCIPKSRDFH
jgi:error-prone DNA polymerase